MCVVLVTQTKPPTQSSQNSYEDEHATNAVFGESSSHIDNDDDLDELTYLGRCIHIDDLPLLNTPKLKEQTFDEMNANYIPPMTDHLPPTPQSIVNAIHALLLVVWGIQPERDYQINLLPYISES